MYAVQGFARSNQTSQEFKRRSRLRTSLGDVHAQPDTTVLSAEQGFLPWV
jgi:hypothetical protein